MEENGAVDRYRLEQLEQDLKPLATVPGDIKALQGRFEGLEKWLAKVESKVDRLMFAVLTLALSIAGSAVTLVITLGGGS